MLLSETRHNAVDVVEILFNTPFTVPAGHPACADKTLRGIKRVESFDGAAYPFFGAGYGCKQFKLIFGTLAITVKPHKKRGRTGAGRWPEQISPADCSLNSVLMHSGKSVRP
jgi:hypothetical protein